MPSPRLMAVVTALMLVAGAQSGQAAYSLAQLEEIEKLIVRKDCSGLWSFLAANPGILDGNDPLAVELRQFMSGVNGGLIDCVSVGPGIAPSVDDLASRVGASY